MTQIICKRNKIVLSLIAILVLITTMTTVAHASWYGFTHSVGLPQQTETTIFEGEYDGNNVGADVWITWDTDGYSRPPEPGIEFIIQKKVWWGWKTVAYEQQCINDQCTVKAWDVGSGTYRFRIYNGFGYGSMNVTKFESYSWE